jgi:phosphoenolpyruvate carboxykinase (ATP)
MEVYLLNTGRVGGGDADERSKKVRIQHSSAIVKGIAEGTIEWQDDTDFGYQVASRVPDLEGEDLDILQPRRLYERQGRTDEYNQIVERLKNERREYMQKWEGLNPEIARAVS